MHKSSKRVIWASTALVSGMGISYASFSARPNRDPPEGTNAIPPQNFYMDTRETNLVSVAPWMIPHDDKKDKGGEDAYFISEDGLALGIFDGVGGWSDSGVNPREYSYTIMEGCKTYAEDNAAKRTPLTILRAGWTYAKSVVGSSTACTVTLNPIEKDLQSIVGSSNTILEMQVANLGDSGVVVVNHVTGEVVFNTREQQHYFNCPFQLGSSSDVPEDSDKYTFQVHKGQTVILGTDGLLDNLFLEQIAEIVKQHSQESTQVIAKSVANAAYEISLNSRAVTPFVRNATASGIKRVRGGKADDITVIVVRLASDKPKPKAKL